MDFATASDTELDAAINAINAEKERRWRLANTPDQIADLVRRYAADGGGDPTVLVDTITKTIQEVDRR